jgi:hypothetical protein
VWQQWQGSHLYNETAGGSLIAKHPQQLQSMRTAWHCWQLSIHCNVVASKPVFLCHKTIKGARAGSACKQFEHEVVTCFAMVLPAVNDPPSFKAASPNVTVEGDTGAYYQPSATHISSGPGESAQNVSFSVACDAAAATLFADQPAISIIEGTGVLSFAPASFASGSSSCNVTLTDGGDLSFTAPLVIVVTAGERMNSRVAVQRAFVADVRVLHCVCLVASVSC